MFKRPAPPAPTTLDQNCFVAAGKLGHAGFHAAGPQRPTSSGTAPCSENLVLSRWVRKGNIHRRPSLNRTRRPHPERRWSGVFAALKKLPRLCQYRALPGAGMGAATAMLINSKAGITDHGRLGGKQVRRRRQGAEQGTTNTAGFPARKALRLLASVVMFKLNGTENRARKTWRTASRPILQRTSASTKGSIRVSLDADACAVRPVAPGSR